MVASTRHCGSASPKVATSVKSARYRPQEWVAAAGGAVLLSVIGVLAAWAHYSLSDTRPLSSEMAAASAVSAVAPPPPSPMSVQLRAWLTRAEPSIDAFLTARDVISSPAASLDIVRTGAACQTAEDAIMGFQRVLPSPDPALNGAMRRAVDGYHVGLTYCLAGVNNRDGDEIELAATYLRRANAAFQAAIGILQRDLPDVESGDVGVLTV